MTDTNKSFTIHTGTEERTFTYEDEARSWAISATLADGLCFFCITYGESGVTNAVVGVDSRLMNQVSSDQQEKLLATARDVALKWISQQGLPVGALETGTVSQIRKGRGPKVV